MCKEHLAAHVKFLGIVAGFEEKFAENNMSAVCQLLGGKVRISTPVGKRVQIDVPEGTRIGDRRRLQGHGHSGGPLDIEFTLAEPEALSKSQREALESLKDSGL